MSDAAVSSLTANGLRFPSTLFVVFCRLLLGSAARCRRRGRIDDYSKQHRRKKLWGRATPSKQSRSIFLWHLSRLKWVDGTGGAHVASPASMEETSIKHRAQWRRHRAYPIPSKAGPTPTRAPNYPASATRATSLIRSTNNGHG